MKRNSKNLGPSAQNKFNYLSSEFTKQTGKVADSERKAGVFTREAIGRRLERNVLKKKGTP